MRTTPPNRTVGLVWFLTTFLFLGGISSVRAQDAQPGAGASAATSTQAKPDAKPTFEIYGFAMLDIGHDFKQIDPDWFDTLRVTKLPRFENQFGEDNSTFMGVRQSRLGFRSSTPTAVGELKTIFEFELFGTGADSGQTTFRLRHAWGELGAFGAGQYWSPFSDPDVYPNSLEYLGPNWYSMVPQRAAPLHADPQRHQQPDARARAPRRKRRPGGVCRPYRASEHPGALSAARFYQPRTSTRRTGATFAPLEYCGGSIGMIPSTTRSISPVTPPGGG